MSKRAETSMATTVRNKELIRGKILYYLTMIYPRAATLPLLQGELDMFGYPIPMEDLQLHVTYLIEKGLAEAESVRGPIPRRQVMLVKATTHGIDTYDGRAEADAGVYFEPRDQGRQ
jgi:hypothetical protein